MYDIELAKVSTHSERKIHFLQLHLDRFSHELCDFNEEQGEKCHQYLRTMEEQRNLHMMTNYF